MHAMPPLTPDEKRAAAVVLLLFLGVTIAVLAWELAQRL